MKTRAWQRWVGLALVTALLGGWSCGTRGGAPSASHTDPSMMPVSSAAQTLVDEVRARFVLPMTDPHDLPPTSRHAMRAPKVPSPVLRAGVASGFELRDGYASTVFPEGAKQGVARSASVALPVYARGAVRLWDDSSHVALTFALRGASDASMGAAGGIAVYAGALAGADVLHRVHAEGTEDYVVFQQRPAQEELTYDVDVSHVAGLRLVSNTLEFLDDGGAPRLRVAPPYLVDGEGAVGRASLALEGCAFDSSPKAPWGRPVTSPGATMCALHVTWRAAAYPAIVDPGWTATGSMATARGVHTATLVGGQVLVAGGGDYTYGTVLSSAELYNPAGGGSFASAGSMSAARIFHTATLVGGKVLLAGGASQWDAATALTSAELYDPSTGSFTVTTTSMAAARVFHTATLLNGGAVLLAGGTPSWGGGGFPTVGNAELYDPSMGMFTLIASPMTTPRIFHTATLLSSGSVLLAGGGAVTATAELYNPAAPGTFTATGPMTIDRAGHTATLLPNGQVLIAGTGDGDNYVLSSAELYDPVAMSFSGTASMMAARYRATGTLLGSGEVLIAGGDEPFPGDGYAAPGAELYNVGLGTFGAAASMATGRFWHSATLLGSGKVLVVGGISTDPTTFLASAVSSAEIYTPSSKTRFLVSIAVTPSATSVPAGAAVKLTATGTFSDGTTKTVAVAWSSDTTSVATVNTRGKVSTLSPGTATITATNTNAGISGTATITVTSPALTAITLADSGGKLPIGVTEAITATGTFSDGSMAPLAVEGLTWSLSNPPTTPPPSPAIVAIPSPGQVQGLLKGSETVYATSGSITGHLKVVVTNATLSLMSVAPTSASIALGDTQAFTATGTFGGVMWDLTSSVTWAVTPTDGSVATIGPDGVATAVGGGTATIQATFPPSGTMATAMLTVTP